MRTIRGPRRWSEALERQDPLHGALAAARGVRAPRQRLDRVFVSVVAVAPGGAGSGELASSVDAADAAGSAVATSGAHAVGAATGAPAAGAATAAGTTAVGKAAATSATIGGGLLGKAIAVGVLGAASVGTAVWIDAAPEPAPPAPLTAAASPAAPAPTASASTRVRAVEAPPTRLVAPAPSAVATPGWGPGRGSSERVPGSVGDTSPLAPSDDRSEAALLGEASAAIASDPVRAMRLLDDAERRFTGGALAQERELLRVQALVALGRRDEAVARAQRLLDRNPSSAHRPRLEKLLPELAD